MEWKSRYGKENVKIKYSIHSLAHHCYFLKTDHQNSIHLWQSQTDPSDVMMMKSALNSGY